MKKKKKTVHKCKGCDCCQQCGQPNPLTPQEERDMKAYFARGGTLEQLESSNAVMRAWTKDYDPEYMRTAEFRSTLPQAVNIY